MASTSKSNYGLTPGEVMDTPIDYTTSIGWKQWEGAIRKLSDELYDRSLDKITLTLTLSDLDKHMVRFDCDVTQFNDFIKTQIDALQARGETTTTSW